MRMITEDDSTVKDKGDSLVSTEIGTVRDILVSMQRDTPDSWMRDNLSISKIDKGDTPDSWMRDNLSISKIDKG